MQGTSGLQVEKTKKPAVVVHPDLHDNADGAAGQSADRHGGENDARGDLKSERDAGEEEAQDGREDEQNDGPGGGGAGSAEADGVVEDAGAFGEQARHELGRLHLHVEVGVVDEGGERRATAST